MFSKGSRFRVYLTYVEPECRAGRVSIWAQTDMSEYEAVEEQLQPRRCANAAGLMLPPQKGDLVVAEYSDDAQWYRAVALESGAGENCRVHFVDFGNVETVRVARMIQPSPRLCDIPGLAQRFFLDDVCARNGRNLSEAEMEFLSLNLINAEFNAEVTCEGTTGFPVTIRLEADLRPMMIPGQPKLPPCTQIAKQAQLSVDQAYEVKITDVKSKLNCHVQLLPMMPYIDRINAEIHAGGVERRASAEELFPGLICAAPFSSLKTLARAVVCELDPPSHSCTVTFIDYGTAEKVDISGLYVLSPKHLSVSAQAINCCIFGQLPIASLQDFLHLTEHRYFVMKVRGLLKSQQYLIEIVTDILPPQVSNVSQELGNRHVAQQISSHHVTQQIASHHVLQQVQQVPVDYVKSKFPSLQFDISQTQNVCISNVNDDGTFSCQLLCFVDRLNSLMMMVNHTPVVPAKMMLVEGMPCIVRSPYDRVLYRAIVLRCQQGNDRIIVELVDFGTRMETTIYDLHDLTEAASMVPIQAIACRLYGADGIPAATLVPLLRRYESKVVLVAQIVEKTVSMYCVNLFDTSTGLNASVLDIARMSAPLDPRALSGSSLPYGMASADVMRMQGPVLSQNQVSAEIQCSEQAKMYDLRQSSICPPLIDIPLKTSLQFCITHVTDNNSFFGQLFPSDHLIALQDTMQKFYLSNNVPCLPSIAVGMHCCCQITVDQRFSRAKVLQECQTQWVVEYIDYGIQEVKDRFQLKMLLPEFAKLPRQSIQCVLGSEYGQMSTDLLAQLLQNHVVLLYIVGQSDRGYIVRLSDCELNQPILMNLNRIMSKPLLESDPNREIVVHLRSLCHAAGTADQLGGFKQQTIPEAEWLGCEVTFVESPSEFYCQLLSSAAILENQLMTDIAQHIQTLPPGIGCIGRPMLALPVLAQFSTDGLWYRARVTGVLKASNRVEVYFVDYGNFDTIATGNIREIPAGLLSYPEMAIRCCLAGVVKDATLTWSSAEIEKFEETVSRKALKLCHVGEKNQRGLFIVHLLDEQENINRSFLRSIGKLDSDYISPVMKAAKRDFDRTDGGQSSNVILTHRQASHTSDHSSGDGWSVNENQAPVNGGRKAPTSDEGRKNLKGGALFQNTIKDVFYGNTRDSKSEGMVSSAADAHPQIYVYSSYHPKQSVKCAVAYVFHPGKFFCQRMPNAALDKLSDELNAMYGCLGNGDNAYHVLSLAKGQACCAKYSEDDVWYRAKVLAVDSGSAVRVQFVDYGNEETVPRTKIRLLAGSLFQIPVMAIPCCLSGVEPVASEWSAEAVSLFNQLIEEEDLTLTFVAFNSQANVYQVELCGPSGVSLQSVLVRNGVAKASRSTSFEETSAEKISCSNTESRLSSAQKGSLQGLYQPRVLNVGTSIQVYISFTFSPGNFWCQAVEDSSRLDGLIESLMNDYDSAVECVVPSPTVGQMCCSRFSADQQWYRATVLELVGGDARVRYVDYGNEDKVPKKSLMILKPNYASLPPQAFECFLFGLPSATSDSWSPQAVAAFNELTGDRALRLVVKSSEHGRHGIELHDDKKNVNVNEELMRYGHVSQAKPTPSGNVQDVSNDDRFHDKRSNFVNRSEERNDTRFGDRGGNNSSRFDNNRGGNSRWETSRTGDDEFASRRPRQERFTPRNDSEYSRPERRDPAANVLDFASGFVYKQPDLAIGSKKKVITSWFNSPADFFVQLEENTSVIEQLQESLHKRYHTLRPRDLAVSNLCSEQVCAALFHQDKNWYRGKIISVSGPIASVLYVDYGNVEQVHLSKLKGLVDECGSLPVQAIRCSLSGAENQKQWEPEHTASISDVFTKTVVVSFKAKANDKYSIEVLDERGASMNNSLLKLETTNSSAQSYRTDIDWKLSETAEVEVVAVDDDGLFYSQLVGKMDELDELMGRLAECCDALQSDAQQMKVGQPCAARFSEDSVWYRAQVESISSDGQSLVRFVDYGNKELRPLSEIRPLKPEFFQLSIQSCKCRLARRLSEGISLSDVILGLRFKATLKKISNGVLYVDLLDEEGKMVTFVDSETATSEADSTVQCPIYVCLPGEVEVYITNAITPSDFYLQLTDQEEKLIAMGNKLHAEYEALPTDELSLSEFVVGRLCCAKFSEDLQWYRAVIKAFDGSKVKVLFVDYGNFDEVGLSDVKRLTDSYDTVPCFAFHCSFSGLNSSSKDWTEEQIARFVELTQNGEKTFACRFITTGCEPFDVALKDGDTDVGSLFLEVSQLPEQRTGELMTVVEGEDVVAAEDSPNEIDKITVYVSHVNSLNDFYIQFASDSERLAQLSSELEEYVVSAPALDEPAVGSLCASVYSLDGAWYRARIEQINDDSNDATIFFVDYGNTDVAQLSGLKVLSDSLLQVSPFARNCGLVDVPTFEFDSLAAGEMLSSVTTDEELGIVVLTGEEKWEVRLILGGEDIMTTILKNLSEKQTSQDEELPVSETVDSQMPNDVEDLSPVESDDVQTASLPPVPRYLDAVVHPGKSNVMVTSISSVGRVYIQLAKDSVELESLLDLLDETYAYLKPGELDLMHDPVVGQACCASHSKVWYRAMVKEVHQDNTVSVFFVDSGISEVVRLEDVKQAVPKLLDRRPLAFECCLVGCGQDRLGDDSTLNRLQDYATGHTLTAQIFVLEEQCPKVILYNKDVCINSDLFGLTVTELMAELQREEPNTRPAECLADKEASQESESVPACLDENPQNEVDEGKTVQIHVSSATSPSDLWVSCSAENPDTDLPLLMERIEALYSNSPTDEYLMNEFKVETLCAAKFSDEIWYRARITKVLDHETVEVFFIDYGNTYGVSTSDVRQLASDLVQLAPQAIKATLTNIRPCVHDGDWDAAGSERFVELVTYDSKPFEFKISKVTRNETSQLIEMRGLLSDDGVDVGERLVTEGLAALVVDSEPNATDKDSGEIAGSYEEVNLSVVDTLISDEVPLVTESREELASNGESEKLFEDIATYACPDEAEILTSVDASAVDCLEAAEVAETEKDLEESPEGAETEKDLEVSLEVAETEKDVEESPEVTEKERDLEESPEDIETEKDLEESPEGAETEKDLEESAEVAETEKDLEDSPEVAETEKDLEESAEVAETEKDLEESPEDTETEKDKFEQITDEFKSGNVSEASRIPGPEESISESDVHSQDSCCILRDFSGVISSDATAYPFVPLVDGEILEATVLSLNDCDGIICQLVETKTKFNELMEKLQLSCQDNSSSLDNPEVGLPCAVPSADDDRWCRAQVAKVLDDGSLEVDCVDDGLVRHVSSERAQALQSELLAIPAQAFRLSLAAENDHLKEYLTNLSPGSSISVTVISSDMSSHRAVVKISSGMLSKTQDVQEILDEIMSSTENSEVPELTEESDSPNLTENLEEASHIEEDLVSQFESENQKLLSADDEDSVLQEKTDENLVGEDSDLSFSENIPQNQDSITLVEKGDNTADLAVEIPPEPKDKCSESTTDPMEFNSADVLEDEKEISADGFPVAVVENGVTEDEEAAAVCDEAVVKICDFRVDVVEEESKGEEAETDRNDGEQQIDVSEVDIGKDVLNFDSVAADADEGVSEIGTECAAATESEFLTEERKGGGGVSGDSEICEIEARTSEEILGTDERESKEQGELEAEHESGFEGCSSADIPTSPSDNVGGISQSSSGIGLGNSDDFPHRLSTGDGPDPVVDSETSVPTASNLNDLSESSLVTEEIVTEREEEC